jgi:hypothetical protein
VRRLVGLARNSHDIAGGLKPKASTHRNPVKRGFVESPELWPWSSCRFYSFDEAGPVQVNVGWGEISFRNGAA